MAFANQRNVLIYDKVGNVYHFRWNESKIVYAYFDRYYNKKYAQTIVEDASLEFDAGIDEENNVYLAYQKKDGYIELVRFKNHTWSESLFKDTRIDPLINLSLLIHKNKIHMIYCQKKDDQHYDIFHHAYEKGNWETFKVETIQTKNYLNSFQVIHQNNQLILGYYNLKGKCEQIFLKTFDLDEKQWDESYQMTFDDHDKLYLDLLIDKKNQVHLTYSEYFQGNLIIQYEQYRKDGSYFVKTHKDTLSNPSNASYPTLVEYNNKLWVIWTEYDQVMSSFSQDMGKSWKNTYALKNSKKNWFFRYKFDTNDAKIKQKYHLNYAFGKDYPQYSFIGFGSLKNAQKIAIKKVKKKEEEIIVKEKVHENNIHKNEKKGTEILQDEKISPTETEVKKNNEEIKNEEIEVIEKDKPFPNEIEELKKDEKSIEERMQRIEERIDHIEEYLRKRRRGVFFMRR